MNRLKTDYSVYALDNRLLLPFDTFLTAKTINELIESNKARSIKVYKVMAHGTVRKDLSDFINQNPYNIIFASKDKREEILAIMENVNFIPYSLDTLDYFKEKDFYTYRHVLIVFALSTLVSDVLLSKYEDKILEGADAPTHDIGKTCVPLNILRKTKPVTLSERRILKSHALSGYILLTYFLKNSKKLETIVARDHHERKDGSGYPCGIKLRNKLVEIILASDIYDALLSPRPYRKVPFNNRTAIEELTDLTFENRINPDILKALISLNRKDKPHYSKCYISAKKRGAPPSDNLYGVVANNKSTKRTV